MNKNFNKNILIVNSNRKNIELLSLFLENDYTLFAAETLFDFDNIIQSKKLDLVLCDISGFPKDILKLFGFLEDKGIPFIIISPPKLDDKSKKELLQRGSSIIEKPLVPEHLKELIKTMI